MGETEMIGLGLGSLAIRAFIDSVVFTDPAITACVSDPETCSGGCSGISARLLSEII
jgi:hypothetical protein